MSLDLTKVASQVGEMLSRLKASLSERQGRLQYALDTLHRQADNIDNLKKKIAHSKTTWLVAGLVDGLDEHSKAPLLPAEFTVIATDGSHIDVDRHRSARCYLINIGSVLLHYGTKPDAILENYPSLHAGGEDLVIMPTGTKGREQSIEGALLGIKRSVEECQRLVKVATGLPSGSSNLALLDGSPFPNYLIPGIILFLFVGILPLAAVYALIKKPAWSWLVTINPSKNTHWAWTASWVSGVVMLIWIGVETLMLSYVSFLQPVIAVWGICIIALTLVPRVRSYYVLA